jgi:hypothetical protein
MGIFERTISVWEKAKGRSADNRHEMSVADFLNLGASYVQTITWLRQWYDYGLTVYATNPQESMRAFDVYKKNKEQMPLGTIGGNYANTGGAQDLIAATRLMCLDIDTEKPSKAAQQIAEGKEVPNAHVTDWQRVKRQLSHLPWVAYCSLSIGGHGLFLIVPIDDDLRYGERWLAAEYLLRECYGLTVDSQTKDETRPRFVSYDDCPYINANADIFTFSLPKSPQPKPPRHSTPANYTDDAQTVAMFVDYIEAHGIDITGNYGASQGKDGKGWADLPPALYSVYGEAGEDFFHRLSQFHPEYNVTDTTKKWNQNKHRSKVGIGTFYMLCQNCNITMQKVKEYHGLPCKSSHVSSLAPETTAKPTLPAPPQIIYRRAPLFPESHSVWDWLSPEEFDGILLPSAVAQWQAAHPTAPF